MADEIVTEIWKAVVGLEGKYEVSSLGRVRSLNRHVSNGSESGYLRKGRILKPWLSGGSTKKYFYVNLGEIRREAIHVLVAESFHGPKPTTKHEVAHWNNNNEDNRPDNLRWATRTENVDDKKRHGTYWKGAKRTLNPEAVLHIRSLPYKRGLFAALSRQYGVGHVTIMRAFYGECWTPEHITALQEQG